MAKFLVTGAAGFIGSNLVEAIVANGDEVRALDDLSTGKRTNLESQRDHIEMVEGSILDLDTCHRAVAGVDYVLHQGALPSVPKSVTIPRETTAVNVMGTVNMLIAARDANVNRFTFAASSSAYGDTPTLPKSEEMTPRPLSPYAVQKLAGEHFCRVFFEQYGLETVALRYFNVFGPRQDPTSQYSAVIPAFITRYLQGQAPTIFGDGSQSRDFTHIDNVIAANLAACTADAKCAGQCMNIACGQRVTILQLAELIRDTLGAAGDPILAEPRAGDVAHSLADISRAQELINYDVVTPFDEGLKKTIAWYQGVNAT